MSSLLCGGSSRSLSSCSSDDVSEEQEQEQETSSCSSLELDDIQEAIEAVRRAILETEERSGERRELVHR